MTRLLTALTLTAGIAAAACTAGKTVERPARERGAALFDDPDLSGSSFNYFSCGDCHSRSTDEGGRIFPGFPLENSAGRAAWWNGYERQYLGAVNFCFTFFMRGQPIAEGQPKGDALYEYLASISPEPSSAAIPFTITRNIPLLAGGDTAAGQAVYDAACRGCHGSPSGKGRLHPSVTALDDELWAYYDTEFPGVEHRVVVTEKVRHGAFFGIGGVMPFFAEERLGDDELTDLLAYLGL